MPANTSTSISNCLIMIPPSKTKQTVLLLILLFQWLPLGANLERPNILFIITDDMYSWQMNFMPESDGRNPTPHLDRLAAEGTIMRNQYVSSSVCTPSRYSCMTGRYASRAQDPAFLQATRRSGQTHVEWNTYLNPDTEQTIAHHLRQSGYRTGFVGKDHVVLTRGRTRLTLSDNPEDPDVRAAMAANARLSTTAIQTAGFEFVERVYQNNPDFNGSRELAVHNQDWITEGALKFLRQKDERPFFLYFATTIPHGPTSEERSWNADRRATPEGWLPHPVKVQPDAVSIARRACNLNVGGRETLIWIDDAIGALLDELKDLGQLQNTIIFFFNDHGQSAKGSIYQGGVHNPSVVWRMGGWPVGPESEALVSNIDFVPTMLELAGAPPAANVDGKSFLPVLLRQTESIHDALFFEMGYTRGVLKDGVKYIALRYPDDILNMSLEERQARLTEMNDNLRDRRRPVHTEDPSKPFGHLMAIPGGHDAEQGAVKAYPYYYDTDQIYDIRLDPNEQTNRHSDPGYLEISNSLQKELQSFLHSLPGEFPL